MATVEPKPRRLTKSYVQKRLRDWGRRIDALFKQIERWAVDEWGEDSVTWSKRKQLQEYPMKQVGVPARQFPVLEIQAGKRQVTFLPNCVWIIGANGRIDVVANGHHYTLCDHAGEDGESSDWQITHPDPRIILEPFSRKVFRRIANARPRRED